MSDELTNPSGQLTDDCYKQLIEWGCPVLELPGQFQNQCIHDFVSTHAINIPHRLAIYHVNSSLTYAQLDDLSTRLANKLKQAGTRPGEKVAVLMDRTPAVIVAMLAIFKIGGIYVPINPTYPDERINYILIDCNPKWVIINNKDYYNEDITDKHIYLDEDYSQLLSESNQRIAERVSVDSNAYVIYTSGSTGEPKGVLIKHKGLMNLAYWYQVCFNLTDDDRSSQFASQGFDTYFCETIPYLARGNSIHIIDDHDKLTPSILLPWLVEQKITICDLPTAYAQILLMMEWPKNPYLRIVKVGGESITRYPSQVCSFDIWNSYGPSEACVETTFVKIFEANTPPENQPIKNSPPPIGKPIANSRVFVVDQEMNLVPIGVTGEILIGGVGVSPGYINRSDLTENKFVPDTIQNFPKEKLYKTGDLAKWLPDGNLEYFGRIDNQVKIRGYRIEIEEVKTCLNQLSDIKEAVILVQESPDGHKNLVAYVIPNLDKIRIPHKDPALITLDDYQYKHATTINFSKEGVGLEGIKEELTVGQKIKIYFKVPNTFTGVWFNGTIMWQNKDKVGVKLITTEEQKSILEKSVEYFLSMQYLSGTLCNPAYTRSIHKALMSKLPEYMIPTKFIALEELPMTVNGKVDLKSLSMPVDSDKPCEINYIEPSTTTENALVKMWAELLGHKKISTNDNFFDLGGNSLLASRLSVMILQKYKITIPIEILFNSPYIYEIASYIDSNGLGHVLKQESNKEIKNDLSLDPSIRPTKKINVGALSNPKSILLTGGAGFLGIHILRELLRQTEAKIYCLVRKGKSSSASDRMLKAIEYYHLQDEISLNDPRIIIIPGDMSKRKFGISSETYSKLAEIVEVVYHCGAEIHMLSNYNRLRNSNVLGTLEVIRFSTFKFDKPIHFVSTLSAANIVDEQDNYVETPPDFEIRHLSTGYATSKWVAENLITQIKNRGLRAYIYRCGNIFGQSETGISNLNDSLLLTIKGCVQLGYAPSWNEKFDILPVDFVSKALVSISINQPSDYDVFHIDQPNSMVWKDLIGWLNNHGLKVQLCSFTEWQDKLTKINQENALFPFISFYLSMPENTISHGVNLSHSVELLKSLKIDFPHIDDKILSNYINYLTKIGFLPPQDTACIKQCEPVSTK